MAGRMSGGGIPGGSGAVDRIGGMRLVNPVGVCCALGIAAMILWCKLMGHTSGFFVPLAGLGAWANARVFWLAGILVSALVCLALPGRMHRLDPVQRFAFPFVSVAGGMSFALAFHQELFDQRVLAVAGLVVSGFGYFWFISRFVLLLALTQGISCLAWSFGCAFVVRYALLILMDAFIPIDCQVMVAIALPLAAIACLEAACALGRRADAGCRAVPGVPASEGERLLWGIRTLPKPERMGRRAGSYLVVMVVAVGLLLSVVRACSISGTWGGDHTAGLDIATGLPLLAAYGGLVFLLIGLGVVVPQTRERGIARFLPGVLIVMAGLLTAALQDGFPPALVGAVDLVVLTNDPFALVFFWATVGCAIQVLSLRPNLIAGVAGAVYAAASIAWVFLVNDSNAVDGAFVLTAAYALFALIAVAFQLHDRARERRLAAPQEAGEASEGCGDSAPGTGEELAAIIQRRCEAVADRYGLSPRERDVLLLLAQGRTGSAIRDELGLAASTVKTHTQHVYAKLAVENRQQLMDMLLGLRG